jgi:phosphopantothenoylcysteine decarboxylase/phosphopantothenate--cysteine ligase
MFIALGIGGGIAAYKACEVVRGLDRAGAGVQVLLTRNATNFITPLTLQTLSRRKALVEQFDLSTIETIQHIELTHRIDALVVAPATANLLAKFAGGVADDLLSTFYTAVTQPVVMAPSMNTRMWLHPATQDNVAILRGRGVTIVGPDAGWLAEGESGWGRMAEPDEIVRAALAAARRSRQLDGRTVLVTAGPTHEPVDPVRYLGNRSSGKMGYALAAAARRRGARVVLVSGPVSIAPPWGVEVEQVETAAQMRRAVLAARSGADAVFMAAAVADHAPVPAASKIKKSDGPLTLTLERGPDILRELGESKGDTLLIGFAAETEDLLSNARKKLEAKNLDFIVGNDVSRPDRGMSSDHNAVTILDRDGGAVEVPRALKGEVAERILDRVFGEDAET